MLKSHTLLLALAMSAIPMLLVPTEASAQAQHGSASRGVRDDLGIPFRTEGQAENKDTQCFIFVHGLDFNPTGPDGHEYPGTLRSVFGDATIRHSSIATVVEGTGTFGSWPDPTTDPCAGSSSSCRYDVDGGNYWTVVEWQSETQSYQEASAHVASEIARLTRGGEDGRGRSCPTSADVTVVGKSAGAVVMDYILGNAHAVESDGSLLNPEFAVVAANIERVVSLAGPHNGSPLADIVCDPSDGRLEMLAALISARPGLAAGGTWALTQLFCANSTLASLQTVRDHQVRHHVAHDLVVPVHLFAADRDVEFGGALSWLASRAGYGDIVDLFQGGDGAVTLESAMACEDNDRTIRTRSTSDWDRCLGERDRASGYGKWSAAFYNGDIAVKGAAGVHANHLTVSRAIRMRRADIGDGALSSSGLYLGVWSDLGARRHTSAAAITRCLFANHAPGEEVWCP